MLLFTRVSGLKKPVLSALICGTLVWATGSVGLFVSRPADVPIQSISVPAFNDGQASLVDFKGKPSVVNLWATWCPPCQRELPLLQKAQSEHPEMHFVFLNQGESSETVRAFLATRAFKLRNVLLDNKGAASQQLSSGALPTTVLLDAQGKIVGSHLGELSNGTLTESLDKLGVQSH